MLSRFLLSRRAALRAGAAVLIAPAWGRAETKGASAVPSAQREGGLESHGLSTFGDLTEKPDFTAFGYVNQAAPKGGMVGQEMYGTFNSLNAYVMRGDPARQTRSWQPGRKARRVRRGSPSSDCRR